MKAACVFSIFIFLFLVIVQISNAVKCASFDKKGNMIYDNGSFENNMKTAQRKNCDVCVVFACNQYNIEELDKNDKEKFMNGFIYGMGCPSDFYDKCTAQQPKSVEKVKNQDANNLVYADMVALYVSGCGDEIDGSECINDKLNSNMPDINEKMKKSAIELRDKINASKNSNEENGDSSGSSNHNGAFKFIGIIIFGWILSAAWYFLKIILS